MKTVQIPSIILPNMGAAYNPLLTEAMNDLVAHTSADISCLEHLQEKTCFLWATEVVFLGAPGNLNFTLQISPYPSLTSAAYFATLGAAPTATIVPTGVHGTVHTATFSWTAHSPYARVLAQMPVAGTPLTAYWVVQVLFSGKS